MAVNLQTELERLYQQNQQQQTGLVDRLNALDAYAGQVNPEIRSQVLDFSNRPAGYNPLNDIATALELSERSRDYRTAAAEDLTRTQGAGMDILSQLDALAQRNAAAGQKLSPAEELLQEMKKEAMKQEIKNGTLKINPKTGELEYADGAAAMSDTTQQVVKVIDKLLKADTRSITGPIGSKIPEFSSAGVGNQRLYDQLTSLLSLDNIKMLKGTGAISDREFQTLSAASSSLSQARSDADFKKDLEQLKQELTGGQIENSNGTKSGRFTIEEVK